jgi:GH24 family phage-related lysozyme (muramidase)
VKTKKQAKGNAVTKAQGHPCLCGCGGAVVSKARFLMGHDAKLKSQLIHAVLDGKGNGAAKKAEAEITRLGWVAFLDKSRGSRDRKAAAKASKEPIA